ncbi:hypothetical protein HY792_01085 [Candidatus Desantisbacteria bacterium]|nr:hypothetical protein [Candidatus Desantisbacteria bacterium]
MMKNAMFFLLMLMPTFLFAETVGKTIILSDGKTNAVVYYVNGKEVAREILDKNETVVKTIGKISDGMVKGYYKSGKLQEEWNFKDGKLEGIKKWYDENGNLWLKWNYKDGKLEGICKGYYKNGNLRAESNYKDDKLIETKEYGPNGMFIDKRWEFIGNDVSGGYWYIDTKTLSYLSGNIIRVWIMKIPEKGSEDYGYQNSLDEIDCSKNMYRVLSSIDHSDDGNVLSSWDDNRSEWSVIEPSSMMEGLQETVCKKREKQKKVR